MGIVPRVAPEKVLVFCKHFRSGSVQLSLPPHSPYQARPPDARPPCCHPVLAPRALPQQAQRQRHERSNEKKRRIKKRKIGRFRESNVGVSPLSAGCKPRNQVSRFRFFCLRSLLAYKAYSVIASSNVLHCALLPSCGVTTSGVTTSGVTTSGYRKKKCCVAQCRGQISCPAQDGRTAGAKFPARL